MRHIIRFLVAAIVLRVVAMIVPGFAIQGFGSALLAALAIMIIGILVEAVSRNRIPPYGRGIVGFLVSAIVLYVIQFLVSGYRIGILSAIIASLIIGFVDLFIPTTRSRIATEK